MCSCNMAADADHECTESDKTTREQFLCDLQGAKDATCEAILGLKPIKEKLRKHQRSVRIARTAGAVGGIIGTGLLFTPFFYVGAAVTVGSAIVGVGTEIGDHVVSSQESNKILEKMKTISECNERINEHHENISKLADELQKEEGLSEEDAYHTAWYWYAYKGTNLGIKGGQFVYQTKRAIQYIRATKVGRGVLTLKEITAIPVKLGKYAGTGVREAYTTLRGLSIVGKKFFGAVSVLLDVYTLVDTWRSKNASLQQAEEALEKLETLEKDYSQKIDALHS